MLKRSLALLTAGALLLLALPNCSSDDGGAGGGACAQYYQALVGYLDRCEGGSTTLRADVQARFESVCGRWLTAPGAANLATTLTSCSQQLATVRCGVGFECEDGAGSLPDGSGCMQGFQCASGNCRVAEEATCGTCAPLIAVGQPCDPSADDKCVEGAACSLDGSGGKGVCKSIKMAKVGEECASSGPDPIACEEGLNCYFPTGPVASTDRPKCRAPAAVGGDCGNGGDCADGLACAEGKCVAAPGLGAACDGAGGRCARGLACGADKKCQTITLVAAGAECDLVRKCQRGECKGLSVSSDAKGSVSFTAGRCVDPLPDGAACTKTDDKDAPGCDAFAECVNGVCTVPDPSTCK